MSYFLGPYLSVAKLYLNSSHSVLEIFYTALHFISIWAYEQARSVLNTGVICKQAFWMSLSLYIWKYTSSDNGEAVQKKYRLWSTIMIMRSYMTWSRNWGWGGVFYLTREVAVHVIKWLRDLGSILECTSVCSTNPVTFYPMSHR